VTDPRNEMPSSTGVRVAGDRYQWGHVWRFCLQMLEENDSLSRANPAVAVGVEVSGAGNLDDVVLFRQTPPHVYAQVKYAVDASSPLGLAYLRDEGILAKFANAHVRLRVDGPVEARLITNRLPDPADVLLRDRDARDGKLLPRAAQGGPGSQRGIARVEWAQAAGVGESGLLGLLEDLAFEVGAGVEDLDRELRLRMYVGGLDSSPASVNLAIGWVEQQVVAGRRRLTLDDVRDAIDQLHLRRTPPRHSVSIATIKPDALAPRAAASLDWSDRMAGDDEWTRVQPSPPHTWAELGADIEALRIRIPANSAVLIGGHFRQATGFFAGTVFRGARGYNVAAEQRDAVWVADRSEGPAMSPVEVLARDASSDDIAVVINASAEGTTAVEAWLERGAINVREVVAFRPAGGPGPNSLQGSALANSFAVQVRDAVRQRLSGGRVHLFLIGPIALSVFLGHHWNRMAPTTVYEHLGGSEYVSAFEVSA
jgi:hypothetical protein